MSSLFGIESSLLGAGIQAGGSILGGLMGGDAAGDAAKAQDEAIGRAISEQRRNQAITQAAYAPYSRIGGAANDRLGYLLGLTPQDITPDAREWALNTFLPKLKQSMADAGTPLSDTWQPTDQMIRDWVQQNQYQSKDGGSYGGLTRDFTADDLAKDVPYQTGLQFGLEQGTRAINERAIANGGYDSGATLKALTRFGNDYGNQKAGEAYNRFTGRQNQTYNMLAGQQGVGMGATGAVTGTNTGTTNALTGLYGDQGNASAAGTVGRANAMAGAFGGVGSAIQGYQNSQILKKLLERNGSWAGTTNGGGTWGYNGGTELA